MRRKVAENETECFRLIETEYLRGPWVMGEQYTVADAYLFTLADWLEEDGVDPRQFTRVYEHRERVRARPVVSKVLAEQGS
jgi:glutathione S-transferase